MSKLRKILFVINPVSGKGKKEAIPQMVEQSLFGLFETEIVFTKRPKHAIELSENAASNGFYAVVAVGGDGSVNEVAQGLIGTNTHLGILPVGSGNGLARHLKIPLNPQQALDVLAKENSIKIDAGEINNKVFVGTAGIGFDAKVAERFWKLKKRGFSNYVKVIFREFNKFIPPVFTVTEEGQKSYNTKAFVLSIANSSQYGNQAIIAPKANSSDGVLELCTIAPFPGWKSPQIAFKLLTGCLESSNYYQSRTITNAKIIGNFNWFHTDGEPFECNGEVNVEIIHKGLSVLVP